MAVGSTPPLGSSALVVAAPAPSDPYPRAPDDEGQPVYPPSKAPPDPLAEKYCDLVHEAGERKRKECCPKTQVFSYGPTAECVRTLSSALQSGAISFKEGGLDACEASVLEEAKQCDWGGEMTSACKGIFVGLRAANETCRSSLECISPHYCRGLGTSKAGVCAAPDSVGARCGLPVESLAAFVHQDAEQDHPSCDGVCFRGRCAAIVQDGGVCTAALQCAPGHDCQEGRCVTPKAPTLGTKCSVGGCAKGHRCSDGACVVERRIGESCSTDGDCRSGACEGGKCTMRCTLVLPSSSSGPKPPASAIKR